MFCSRFRYLFPRVVSGFHQKTRTAHYDRHHLPAPCLAVSYPPITNQFLRQNTVHGDCLGPFILIFGILAFSGRGLASTRWLVSLAVHLAAFQRCGSCRVNTQVWVSMLSWDFLVCCGLFFLFEKVELILASGVRDRLLSATRDIDGTI
jgi:hypothetical protein